MDSNNAGQLRNFAATRPWRAPARWTLIALIFACGQAVYAGDAGEPRWHASSTSLTNCQLAVEARRSMMADPLLAHLNIGVTVADSTATVWGTVPDAETAARIRSRLSAVAGISTVVNDVCIDPDSKSWSSRDAAATVVSPASGEYKTGLASGCPRSGPASFTGIVPPMTLNPGSRTPVVTLLKPTLTDSEFADQLETLRQSVPRFRQVGIRSVGSVVYLRPYNASPVMMMEFAGRISQLPGVGRVLLEDTRRQSGLAIP